MIASYRATALALAISIALGHASAVAATGQPNKPASAASKRAIIGGDADAIIGGDADAIIGGDRHKSARAIIGGDADAIIGGDVDGLIARGIIAHGPVESIDMTNGLVTIVGQTYRFGGTAAHMKALQDRLASGSPNVATVTGARDKAGAMKARAMSIAASQYVPGASNVLVVGRVKSADASIGALVIGSLRVDYSNALSSATAQFVIGQTVAVLGVQSGPNMPLVASDIRGL